MIPDTQRAELLSIARRAIEETIRGGSPLPLVPYGPLAQPAGAFVTLHINASLRGCIGHVEADRPLARVVAECAVSAATADPRFPRVTGAELPGLHIEVSVLGAFERVSSMAEIEVGRHGLLVEHGWRRGLLLPQVAPEWGWDVPAFVAHTCEKAGLPPDAWPARGAVLFRFEAEVFAEPGPR